MIFACPLENKQENTIIPPWNLLDNLKVYVIHEEKHFSFLKILTDLSFWIVFNVTMLNSHQLNSPLQVYSSMDIAGHA